MDANTCWYCRGCGPKGYPGMPEVSNMPLPKKLLAQGVRDMVRICDGRIRTAYEPRRPKATPEGDSKYDSQKNLPSVPMSGTAYGTVVLHVVPEGVSGGPRALVQTGDEISLDVPGRILTLEVSEEKLLRRRPNAATLGGGRSRRLRSCKIAQA